MKTSRRPIDPVELAILRSVFHSIAEEMGAALRRTSFSPNIKERRDYSCAVFDSAGNVIAMGDHMPVHLGSMPMSVRTAIDTLELAPGDVAILNDPYGGGTHLPDITMVMPVHIGNARSPLFYVSSRAHHADVGGCYPGSMGPCREIYQEGVRIPPVRIMQRGQVLKDVMNLVLNNVRTPAEREGDLTAQIGACRIGGDRLRDVVAKYGRPHVQRYTGALLDYSERLMREQLKRLPAGVFRAEDFLDNDGVADEPIAIRAAITLEPRSATARVDFSGSDPQCAGSINAVYAITYSAVYYVFRCLLSEDAPATAGIMRPIEVIAPEGTIVNARPPAAVAGGNVETSQRIVDVLMRALAEAAPARVPAASSGTMNNLTIGGLNPAARGGLPFAYYETTAGGMGARPGADGLSGVHTHMTNSLNTPVEALEYAYPFRVRRYGYRPGSGGNGKFRGGDGLVREIELLTDAQVTLLADRRKRGPYGLAGGEPGAPGRSLLIGKDGNTTELPAKCSIAACKGDRVRIESPGGGGWGDLALSGLSAR
ncbi:MAG: hydantoinase B/oxoprolinase family protein [Acidobacteria bacterium]|nr:hydantoinase B/oxoprolinase family protein [Acidobacteriota bacterium]